MTLSVADACATCWKADQAVPSRAALPARIELVELCEVPYLLTMHLGLTNDECLLRLAASGLGVVQCGRSAVYQDPVTISLHLGQSRFSVNMVCPPSAVYPVR